MHVPFPGDSSHADPRFRPATRGLPGLLAAWLLLVALQGGPAGVWAAPAGPAAPGQGTLTLDFKDADLRDVLRAIARQQGVNVVADPTVQARVTVHLAAVPFETGLQLLLNAHGLTFEKIEGGGATVYWVKRQASPAPYRVTWEEGRVSIDATEAPAGAVVRALARKAGINIFLPARPLPPVTLYLRELPLDAALEALAAAAGFNVAQEGDRLYRLVPAAGGPGAGGAGAPGGAPPGGLGAGGGVERVVAEGGRLTVVAREADLAALVDAVARRAGLKLAVAGDLAGLKVTGSVGNLPPRDALHALLRPHDLELVPVADGFEIRRKPSPPPFEIGWDGTRLTLAADQAPLGQLLLAVARETGATLVVAPEIADQRVSGRVEARPLQEALRFLLEPHGLELVEDQGRLLARRLPAPLPPPPGKEAPPGGGPSPAPPPRPAPVRPDVPTFEVQGDRLKLEARGARLEDLLELLGPSLSLRLVPYRELAGRQLNLRWEGPLAEALAAVAGAAGARTLPLSEGYLLAPVNLPGPLVFRDPRDGRYYVEARRVDLGDVLYQLAVEGRESLVVPLFAEVSVRNVQLYGVPFEEALDLLLEGTPFVYTKLDGTYLIGDGVTPRPDSLATTVSRRIPLRYVDPERVADLLPSSLPARNLRPLPDQRSVVVTGSEELVDRFADYLATIDRPPGGVEQAYLPVRHANLEELANLLSAQLGKKSFQFFPSQRAVAVFGPPEVIERARQLVELVDRPGPAREVALLPLEHLPAERAKELLPPDLKPDEVSVLTEANALLVRGDAARIAELRTYLQRVDVVVPQITLDVLLVEFTDRQTLRYGVKGELGDGVEWDTLTPAPLSLRVGPRVRLDAAFRATLNALVQKGKAKVLANPQLTILDNEEASFRVVTVQRFFHPIFGGIDGNDGNEGGDGNDRIIIPPDRDVLTQIPGFLTVETGVQLTVRPRVAPDGSITLSIEPSLSSATGGTTGAGLPETHEQAVQTKVRVHEGETIVIGGLIQHSFQEDESGVPILQDLPLLGALFRGKHRLATRSEFVAYITPYVSWGSPEQGGSGPGRGPATGAATGPGGGAAGKVAPSQVIRIDLGTTTPLVAPGSLGAAEPGGDGTPRGERCAPPLCISF